MQCTVTSTMFSEIYEYQWFHAIREDPFRLVPPLFGHCPFGGGGSKTVCPSGPSMDGRARVDVRLWKIARLKHVFL